MRLALALLLTFCVFFTTGAHAKPPKEAAPKYPAPAEVRAAFRKQLDRPKVPLDPKVLNQSTTDGIVVEQLDFASEKKADGMIERVPTLLVRPESVTALRPCVIVLHGTGGNKTGQRGLCIELAKLGFVAVAIDARYHGDRAGGAAGAAAYVEAITKAWRTKPGEPQEHPFYYDTVWDLWRTVDYLQTRAEIDPKRIGMIGFSMGGIQTWLAASVDERVKASVPAIAVQSFRWSLEHDQWEGRANTIRGAHNAAAADLGEKEINQRVCRELWSKVIPGILDEFDCPSMLRLFADRDLLIVSGEKDPNCPIGGAEIALASAREAFRGAGREDHLKIDVAEGVAHSVTPEQKKLAIEWFVEKLKP